MSGTPSTRRPEILEAGAAIVRSYDTPVTLRQLFYRLVAALLLRNTRSEYSSLSSQTARARRARTFPALLDRTRKIERYQTFDGAGHARHWLASIYRRDRTEGQEFNLYLGVEKKTLIAQLDAWFGDLGLPILPLGGYSSEPFEKEVIVDIEADGRPAILIYAGDFDPSGEDIDRNFIHQVGRFEKVVRVALLPEQIEEYNLPPQPGKESDSRSQAFTKRHGRLVQVELEALDPETLRGLYREAIDAHFDLSVFEDVLAVEDEERQELLRAAS
ncbi:MAG TPA: hypothetical protein VNB06_05510 [Thermoanaerobaculia bacterium]|nr:hypothetical protein [Thermoanaerobaculia bacterium]